LIPISHVTARVNGGRLNVIGSPVRRTTIPLVSFYRYDVDARPSFRQPALGCLLLTILAGCGPRSTAKPLGQVSQSVEDVRRGAVMKTRLLRGLFVVLTCVASDAQDRFQVFGGYSLIGHSVTNRYSGPTTLFKFNGWDASFTAKVAPHVALEADFPGGVTSYFQTPSKTFAYMAGPRLFLNRDKATIYGHVLVGGMTFSAPIGGVASTSFALAVGGGGDYWFNRHLGVQLIEADYLHNNNTVLGPSHADFRISTGVVFRFGRGGH